MQVAAYVDSCPALTSKGIVPDSCNSRFGMDGLAPGRGQSADKRMFDQSGEERGFAGVDGDLSP